MDGTEKSQLNNIENVMSVISVTVLYQWLYLTLSNTGSLVS